VPRLGWASWLSRDPRLRWRASWVSRPGTGWRCWGAGGVRGTLGELPEGVELVEALAAGAGTGVDAGSAAEPFDVVLWFGTTVAGLRGIVRDGRAALTRDGGLWIGWPKRASGIATEVDADVVREVALPTGLVGTTRSAPSTNPGPESGSCCAVSCALRQGTESFSALNPGVSHLVFFALSVRRPTRQRRHDEPSEADDLFGLGTTLLCAESNVNPLTLGAGAFRCPPDIAGRGLTFGPQASWKSVWPLTHQARPKAKVARASHQNSGCTRVDEGLRGEGAEPGERREQQDEDAADPVEQVAGVLGGRPARLRRVRAGEQEQAHQCHGDEEAGREQDVQQPEDAGGPGRGGRHRRQKATPIAKNPARFESTSSHC
jgi:hypothetical protein